MSSQFVRAQHKNLLFDVLTIFQIRIFATESIDIHTIYLYIFMCVYLMYFRLHKIIGAHLIMLLRPT